MTAGRGVGAGLCDACLHQQVVRTTRGSAFSLCRRSKADPAYRKYPPIPVVRCAGFEPATSPASGSPTGAAPPPSR